VEKYRYHWQKTSGKLIQRWDNANHHPELDTHPHHTHIQEEEKVQPHKKTNLGEVLEEILRSQTKKT